MTDISRRQLFGGAAALLLGSVFHLSPEQAEAVVEKQIVPESPDVPTFVVRGTQSEPRISLEGELGGGKLGGVWFTLENHYEPFYDASGMVPLSHYATARLLTIMVTTPFALRDERVDQ